MVVRDKKCLKCGSKKKLHASHILPKGTYPHLQWHPRNIKALCYYHHLHWWHKNPIEAGEWYKKRFPKNWKYLKTKMKQDGKRKHLDYQYNKRVLERAIKKCLKD